MDEMVMDNVTLEKGKGRNESFFLQTIVELIQEAEGSTSPLISQQFGGHAPNIQQQAGTQQHLAVELADTKAKVWRLRQEL